MKIVIDTEFQGGITLPEVFLLACINLADNNNVQIPVKDFMDNCKENLICNGLLDDYNRITKTGRKLLKEIVTGNTTEINIDSLTEKLRNIYPMGKKPGTEHFWRSNPSEVKEKLKRFFQLYHDANITEEEIITATEIYIRENEYNHYMRLLKHFIIKMEVDRTYISDLYTCICAAREGSESTPAFDNQLI